MCNKLKTVAVKTKKDLADVKTKVTIFMEHNYTGSFTTAVLVKGKSDYVHVSPFTKQSCVLTLFQTTIFRRLQTGRVCRQQLQS